MDKSCLSVQSAELSEFRAPFFQRCTFGGRASLPGAMCCTCSVGEGPMTTPPCARRGPCPIYVRDAWIAPGSEHLKQLSLVCTAILKRQAEALTSVPPGKSSMCEKKKTSKSSGSCSACVNTHATAFRCGPPPSAEFSRPSPKLGRRRSLNPPAHWPMVP